MRVRNATGVRKWTLVGRLVASSPGQFALVGLVFTLAATAGVIAHQVTLREFADLAAYAGHRYGTVSVRVARETPDTLRAPTMPMLARTPGALGADEPHRVRWITHGATDDALATARAIGLRLVPRIEAAAFGSDGVVRPLVAISEGDSARAAIPRPAAAEREQPRHRVALRRTQGSEVEWHTIPRQAVLGVTGDDVLWIRVAWLHGVLRPDDQEPVGVTPVATSLVVADGDGDASLAFAAAYDLSSLLADAQPPLEAFAWPELVGFERYVGSGGGAALLRPLALVVAAVAAAGAVGVAARTRIRDVVLLRTIGLSVPVIRGIYARETALAALAAALLVATGIWVVSQTGATVVFDATVRRTLVGTAVLPPLVAFLTLRRQLGAPLARIRRESES